jgi:hypothetical protein
LGPKSIQFLGPALKKKEVQNYGYSMRYEGDYLFETRMHNKLQLQEADKYHKSKKIQKNSIIFLLTDRQGF